MTNKNEKSYPLHRQKLLGLFEEGQTGVVYIRGAEMAYRYGTDYEYPFRQESGFWYLTGVNEPDYHMILDLKSQEYHLFAPKRDKEFAVWHGRIRPESEIRDLYRPDHLHYDSELLSVLKDLSPDIVYCLNEEQAEFLEDLDRSIKTDTGPIEDAITWCRCLKTDWELEQLREAARINDIAHWKVPEVLKSGMYEYEMKAVFEYHQVRLGLTQDAYNGIHASGPNSAILHYVSLDRQMNDGDLYLIDAGFEFNGYASDVTRTWPVSGRFTDDQAAVYRIVRQAHRETIRLARPGVKMEDLHMAAVEIIIDGLHDMGILKGNRGYLKEIDIHALFFPHGLGHFLGLDTHDVGGYPEGVERIDRPGIRHLRARRELQAGMVVTIEPGLYFIPELLRPALENKTLHEFLNVEKLKTLFEFGGVRLENNLAINEDGNEDLTKVPADLEEIEALMRN